MTSLTDFSISLIKWNEYLDIKANEPVLYFKKYKIDDNSRIHEWIKNNETRRTP